MNQHTQLLTRGRVVACAAALVISQLLFPGCRSESPPGTPATTTETPSARQQPVERTLTVYCGRNEEMMAPLFARFEEETDIRLRVQYASSPQLTATIVEEGARTPADVFFSQDVGTLEFLHRQGLLDYLSTDVLQRVPPAFRSPEKTWVGTSGRARTLVYNTTQVQPDQLPARIDDLLKPEWRGLIGWAPENASFQAFVGALILERGMAETVSWLHQMKQLDTRAFSSNMRIVEAVAKGEIHFGFVNHYYLHRMRQEHGPTLEAENHYFRNHKAESLVNGAGIGVLKTSASLEDAHRLVDWLLQEEAQRYFAERTYEFPLLDGIATDPSLPAFDGLQMPETALGDLGDLAQAVAALREAGVLP